MKFEMRMPDLATTDSPIKVLNWLVQIGAPVKRGQAVVEVETDKATMEVEATVNGTLLERRCERGAELGAGEVLAIIETSEEAAQTRPGSERQRSGRGVPATDYRIEEAARETPIPLSQSRGSALLSREFMLTLYERILVIREFEERVKMLFLEGAMPGTIHQCQGQEATAVGICGALGNDDFIVSTFRGHGHALAKGLSVQEMLDELFGAGTGCCKGKGGSMHLGNMEKGMLPAIAIVGGGIPLAAGMALAFKMRKTKQVVACFFGDGAVAEGAFHEGLNMAAIWTLPVVFVCENNLYGASTRIDKVMKRTKVSDRAASYGFRGETVDGNDLLAVYEAAGRAIEECRNDQGPILLELLTYRRTGHSRRDPCHYQAKDEREAWLANDPIDRFAEVLLARGDISWPDLSDIKEKIDREITEAIEKARQAPPPGGNELLSDVYA
jgi:pyruvate dehydrogenase E1 component alpha subunit